MREFYVQNENMYNLHRNELLKQRLSISMKSKKGKNKERLALKYQYQCVLEAGAEVTQHLNGKYIKTHEIEIMSQK